MVWSSHGPVDGGRKGAGIAAGGIDRTSSGTGSGSDAVVPGGGDIPKNVIRQTVQCDCFRRVILDQYGKSDRPAGFNRNRVGGLLDGTG